MVVSLCASRFFIDKKLILLYKIKSIFEIDSINLLERIENGHYHGRSDQGRFDEKLVSFNQKE